ncbi:MAG: DNA polymerase III subunit gamma/tau [Chlamydiae bacterium]|nr:DNA polymerase III subunit gamma/tau [Chlamydiota bacterium]
MSPSKTYQVIARKYRPQTFADVIGQTAIVTTLKNALKFHKLAHAYLFCGCRGTGKTTLARVFSKALNCQRITENFEPCNECQSCLEISQGRSLDVIEIDGASHRGIDDIRQINDTIGYAPSSGKYKIYIIDEVHMLTKEAFNALLKTLEEPPANVKFFFATTEPHKVLQTIMSRCQRFDLSRITFPLIQEKLAKIAKDLEVTVEEDALGLIAKLSEGSLRDAESLFDQVLCYNEGTLTVEKISTSLGMVSTSAFFELDEAVVEQDYSYAFVLAERVFSSGKDLSYFLDSLMEHFRTILVFQLGQAPQLSPLNNKKYLHASSAIYSQEQCLYILDYLLTWIQQLSKSTFKRISIEMILLHIIRSKKRMPIDALVRRLHELQKTLPAPDKLQEANPTLKIEQPTKLEPRVEQPVAIMKVEESAPAILETAKEIAPVVKIAEPIQLAPELKIEEPVATIIHEDQEPILETAPVAKITEPMQLAPELKVEEPVATIKVNEPVPSIQETILDIAPIANIEETAPLVPELNVEEPVAPIILEEPAPLVQDLLEEVVAPESAILNTPEIIPSKAETPIIIDMPAYAPPVNELEVIAPEPVVIKEKPKAEPMPTPALENIKPYKPQIKHETVLRFAAVELDGVFSKN